MSVLIVIAGQYLVIVIGLVALIITVFAEKEVRWSIIKLAILSFGIAFLAAYIAGLLYYNARPFVVERIEPLIAHQPDNGFPSDHTWIAMTTASIIFVYRRWLGIVLGLLGILIGIARVMAYLHHPVDIVASVFIAVIVTFCAWLMLKRFDWKFKSSS